MIIFIIIIHFNSLNKNNTNAKCESDSYRIQDLCWHDMMRNMVMRVPPTSDQSLISCVSSHTLRGINDLYFGSVPKIPVKCTKKRDTLIDVSPSLLQVHFYFPRIVF